ncbi:accessory Sec system S-layer assembly protein [Brevibacillus ruminantium]|uniref:Accessory Sec system S-layer assembly protein n=1 Tax=Brevibacillus ruminantium TaxID=2950604 RepID=A0ABY4WDT6_9BACL|nr:accessory Sec system S-layer assembly protein [Brevibacillus ruminantium]USG65345.1 accessory Sec system S-layer assembly protein [Brevibacillus ruminantium]
MLSFLKNFMGKTPTPEEIKKQLREESVLSAEQSGLADEKPAKKHETGAGATPLSLHESWEKQLNASAKYALSFTAQELPPIQSDNISITGLSLVPHEQGIEVTAFLRNGTDKLVRLQKMTLVVLFDEDELFARQEFDMSEVGEIPPHSARPWAFVFTSENFLKRDVLLKNWKIAFELAQKKMVLPQQLELEESWIRALNDQQKQSLIELAKRLPALKEGEVNIQSVQIRRSDEGSLHAMLLIRNGSTESLTLDKLPLALHDAAGQQVAVGLFELNGLTVRANTSKPWMFIFPKESILIEEPDLSRWKVSFPQGS